jgi:Cu2+-exporting ATPase
VKSAWTFPLPLAWVLPFWVSSAATFDPTGVWGSEVYFDSLSMFVFFLLTEAIRNWTK